MLASILLTTFFLWPGSPEGVQPVSLSGEDMRADWTNHAQTARICETPKMPEYHILQSWHKVGVTMLKRVAYDPEETAEHFRRNIGILAFHEGADGVWLIGREEYPASWRAAYAEAEKDVAVFLYAKELAEQAMTKRFTAPNTWMAGRHVLWQFAFMDVEMEDLDTIRLEFICYARYLEQLLGLPKKAVPFEASKPTPLPDRAKIKPFEGQYVEAKNVSLVFGGAEELAPGLSLVRNGSTIGFRIESKQKIAKGTWPGGVITLKFYLPGPDGTWLPYEWRYDMRAIEAEGRAPSDAYGLWFGDERWGKGVIFPYGEPKPWRATSIMRGSKSPMYPYLRPRPRMEWGADGGWRLTFEFSWHEIYHQWPAIRTGERDSWYVGLTGARDVPDARVRIDWPVGREANFRKIAEHLDYEGLSRYYERELEGSEGVYGLWQKERLYDWQKVPEETWHRGETESDKVFHQCVVEPLVEKNANIWDIVYSRLRGVAFAPHSARGPKIGKLADADKLRVWKGLGRLFDIAYNVSKLRRDYLLGRQAGKMPPPPKAKPPKEDASILTAPDVDNDDNALKLDEEAY